MSLPVTAAATPIAAPTAPAATASPRARRVLLLGATGTIGQATARALVARGHEVVCFVRPRAGVGGSMDEAAAARRLAGAELRFGDVCDAGSLAREGLRGERFDALVSCLASRTGAPADAWAIDHRAHVQALEATRAAGVTQVVLLSAICVQKPLLAFQQAKLAFERVLIDSGLSYSIVRPTAFFKSLSGQVERVRRGKPFLIFGDGTLTACKPISDADLGAYLADCLDDPARQNRILPIGGPGEAITPRQQGEALFALLGRPPHFQSVPVRLLDLIIAVLGTLGRVVPALAAKAELARIGRYYATESMLVLDPQTGVTTPRPRPRPGATRWSRLRRDAARGRHARTRRPRGVLTGATRSTAPRAQALSWLQTLSSRLTLTGCGVRSSCANRLMRSSSSSQRYSSRRASVVPFSSARRRV